jgi:mannitol-1-phosphate 5-dehydrogenase
METNKLILFGAGKIGRSFIGQLFSRSGYEVVFIDIAKNIIHELNLRKSYHIIIKDEKEEVLTINNVRGIHLNDENNIINEISTASIMAVSVGYQNLISIIPIIAKGLLKRYKIHKDYPLDIIIAENMRNGAEYMKEELKKFLPESYQIENLVGLIETSIGKMVPIIPQKEIKKDILLVYAEPYNTLIVDKLAFKNPPPDIKGLSPKNNIKAWVDRKLFIHNLGHASAAYYGYYHHPELSYMHEVLSHDDVKNFTRKVMLQSAIILDTLYPGVFTEEDILDHIDDLISRFCNKFLKDTIFRVGCDLQRKLSYNDRLMAPFHAGTKLGLNVDKIAEAIFYGTQFKATDENGNLLKNDIVFFNMINKKGVMQIIKSIGKLNDKEYNIMKTFYINSEQL